MAFDGITISAIVHDLKETCLDGRIYKIAQPEKDEILLTIKTSRRENGGDFGSDGIATKRAQVRVVLSANASLPLVYITDDNKVSPEVAPTFCMFLRKHIQNGRIVDIYQPDFERIIVFEIEHLDEMGDLKHKFLNVELMGKHSNIIFTDDEDNIIDSIKHISHNVSSVREVLPGRKYFIPGAEDKLDALSGDKETFISRIKNAHMSVSPAIYKTYTGFSPIMASEVCHRANVDADASTSSLDDKHIEDLANVFFLLTCDIKAGRFAPEIAYEGKAPAEFAAVKLSIYDDLEKVSYDSISELIFDYYSKKSIVVRIRQKSSDLRRIVTTALERNVKKLDLQQKQLKDTEKRDKYKVYGELINTYGYSVPEGAKSFEALNYYTNETITIPLDETISVKDNAKRYFDKYSKLKRTAENLTTIIEEVTAEIEHLRSILNSLDIAEYEEDLTQIKEELIQSGYIRFKSGGKKVKITSKPFHYVSSDGFDIYVGKNNFQNDELTFDFANGNDWWFHAKKMPGSHVVLKSGGKEVPDRAFEEAARLAAFYSAGKQSDKVEIDYTIKKNVKKPAGAKPGFVVYYTNYSMTIDTDISMLKLCKD